MHYSKKLSLLFLFFFGFGVSCQCLPDEIDTLEGDTQLTFNVWLGDDVLDAPSDYLFDQSIWEGYALQVNLILVDLEDSTEVTSIAADASLTSRFIGQYKLNVPKGRYALYVWSNWQHRYADLEDYFNLELLIDKQQVSLTEVNLGENYAVNTFIKNAFYASSPSIVFAEDIEVKNIFLTSSLGKLRLVSSDYLDLLDTYEDEVVMEFGTSDSKQVFREFDLNQLTVTNDHPEVISLGAKDFLLNPYELDKGVVMLYDYLLTGKKSYNISVRISTKRADGSFYTRVVDEVPIVQNKVVNLVGDIFDPDLKGGLPNVDFETIVEDAFSNTDNIRFDGIEISTTNLLQLEEEVNAVLADFKQNKSVCIVKVGSEALAYELASVTQPLVLRLPSGFPEDRKVQISFDDGYPQDTLNRHAPIHFGAIDNGDGVWNEQDKYALIIDTTGPEGNLVYQGEIYIETFGARDHKEPQVLIIYNEGEKRPVVTFINDNQLRNKAGLNVVYSTSPLM